MTRAAHSITLADFRTIVTEGKIYLSTEACEEA
jgi:hypothetical protein